MPPMSPMRDCFAEFTLSEANVLAMTLRVGLPRSRWSLAMTGPSTQLRTGDGSRSFAMTPYLLRLYSCPGKSAQEASLAPNGGEGQGEGGFRSDDTFIHAYETGYSGGGEDIWRPCRS